MASIQLISKPLLVRRSIDPIRFIIPFSSYSTHLPKKAAGAFTSNKHINKTENSNLVNKTLVYIGPFSETIRRYKMTASLFGACGICAVPALLSTGEAPTISVMLAGLSAISPSIFIHWYTKEYAASLIAYEDIKTIERQRKKPLEIKDMWLGIETWSFFGVKKEQNMWLSQLFDVSDRKMMKWKYKNNIFAFEHGVMDADPFLKGLVKKMASNNSNRKIEK